MAFGDTITEAVLGKVSVPEDTDNTPNAVAEGAAVNTTVGITAHSTFANGNAGLDYTLSADSSGGGFKIDQNTGVVTVADPSKIDFESAPGHVYTITVLATKNNNFSSSQTFTISVNDVAPSAPVDSNAAANTVLEGAANGTTVGVTASSTDVNGGAVTYSLIGDTSGGGFTVNTTTGVVTVADGSKIDFESSAGHAYTVTVQSSDGTLTSSQAFTINVGDVALTTPVDTNGAGNSVAEGAAAGTTVGITASATDPSGPATTYSLIGDTSGGGFTINASTGVVTVANPAKLDFESSAPGHTYNITVQASNGTTTTSQVFTVGVTDVAPSAPIDSNTAAADTVAEGAANGTAVGITASSTDVNGGAITYSLTGDTSGGGFTINATTGVITVADSTKINFETAPGHAYTVTAQSSDGTLANSQTFTIAVTDVAPSTPVDSNGATNTVAEGAANGSTVGITASSTDVNGPGVAYSLVGDTSGGGFTINATTGVITVADSTKLDYETGPAGHAYTVTAQASDGTLSSSQTFTIALTDVAPTAPTDINGATNTVAEGAANGSTVGITASSVDPNGPATTYSLTDNAGGRFAINSSTGIVTVANGAAIDFETAPGHAYGITVQATNGALTTSSAFSIGVTDVGPSTPADINGAADSVFEGAANGSTVGITASSTDPGTGPTPTYSLTDSAGGRFTINSTTGVVTVANGAAIDFETAPGPGHSYGITVQSTAGALSTTQNFSILVGDVNEAPAGTDKTVTMLEGDSYTFSVADFGFSDPSDSVNPNSLLAVKMTTVPGAGTGTFTNNGVTVNAGDSVSATDIAAGHLVFTPTAHSNGAPEASFTFQVQDNGGTANNGVDLDQSANTVTINVNAVNDAPINSVPGAQSVNEEGTLTFSSGTGNAITISDIDVGSGNETVTLTVTNGTLALGSHAGLVSFSPDNAASITLTGTIANIDNALNGLTYTGNLNFNGTETLTVSTNDNGNTGAGGPKIDSDPITINVAAVDDAPVNTVPGAQTVNEDTALVFNGAKTISISDVDANGGNETVTLSVASGTLTLSGTTGLVFGTGDGTADSTMTFTGTVSDINTALNGLSYQGNLNFNGSDTLNITTNDNGNTGSGGPLSDTDSVVINVTAVNDAPVNTVPGAQTVNEDTTLVFNGANTISIADVDASGGSETVTLSVASGALTLSGTTGLSFATGDGTADSTMTFSGTVSDINTALNGLSYHGNLNFNGSDTLSITTNDNGNSGSGGAQSDIDSVTINVSAVNDAPVNTVPGAQTVNEDTTLVFNGANTISISDVDANGGNETVTLSVASGALTLSGTTGLTFTTGDGSADSTMTFSGTVSDINTALNGLSYHGNQDFNGSDTLNITTNDNGNAGSGGAQSDTDGVTINVSAVNDAPVNAVPGAQTVNEDTALVFNGGKTISISDVDANGGNETVTLSVTNGALTLSGTAGLVFGTGDGTADSTMTFTGTVGAINTALAGLSYQGNADFNGSDSLSITTNDNNNTGSGGALSDTDSVSITVNAVNDAPTLTAHDRDPSYAPGGVQLFDSASVSVGPADESAQNIKQLVLTVSNVDGTGTTDHMSIDGTNVFLTDGNTATGADHGVSISVALAGGTATVTISKPAGDIPAADVATIVNGLTYTDDSVDPGEAARHVTLTSIQDNGGGTAPNVDTTVLSIDSTVNFNVAPTVAAGGTLSYTENNGPTVIDSTIDITDPDSPNMASAKVAITGGFDNTQDLLSFTPSGGITGSYDPLTGVLTLSGNASQAAYETVLGTVTYQNSSDNPSTAQRTVSYTVNDGFVDSAAGTATVTVAAVNDAPVITPTGGSTAYTENAAAVTVDGSLTVADPDSSIVSAQVRVSAGFQSGDTLNFTDQNGITHTYNSGTGVLTLTGTTTPANYQAALRSITFSSTNDDPGASKTVEFKVNDSIVDSNLATKALTITPVNDAPTLTATSVGGTFTEPAGSGLSAPTAGAVDLFSSPHASAIEAGQAFKQVVVTVSNVGDTTEFLDINGVAVDLVNGNSEAVTAGTATVAVAGGTATVTINATSTFTQAQVESLVDSLAYDNNDDSPTATSHTVTVTSLTDSGGTLNGGVDTSALSLTASVTVVPTNDLPTAPNWNFSASSANDAIGNTALVLDNGAAPLPPDPAGPQKTISGSLLTGATDVDGPGPLVTVAQNNVATAHGHVTVNTSGEFSYTPNAGYIGTDTFNYQVSDQNPGTPGLATGSITVNVAAPKVWYVSSTTGSDTTGDGTSEHPFASLAPLSTGGSADSLDGANDTIFVYNGTYNSGIVLESGQQLIGQSQGLTVNGTTLETATAGNATINGTVTLASGNTIDGITFGNTSGFSLQDSGATVGTATVAHSSINNANGGAVSIANGGTLAMNFSSITASGTSTSAIALANTTGTFTGSGGTLNNGAATAADVSITGDHTGDDVNFTYNGAINDSTGTTVAISGQSGGIKDFNGAITGGGIALTTNNTGATVNFDGALSLSTGAATAFSASGGGTLNVTDASNSITTTTGTALNLNGVTVGGSGVAFNSVTTNGAATAISIDTVTGGAINVNGGTIAGATTRGVDINAAQNNITVASSIGSTGGHSVEVTNSGKSGGNTILFSGAVTDTGGGINLDNNDQNGGVATVNFTGALNIDSTVNTGFNATNGGTVNATNAANSLNTTTGTALNVANTTIGSSNLIFHDISANGAVNGIVLNNTGSTGGLTVTGSNSVASAIRDSSGGTIQNTTGAAISLTNTTNAAFNNVNIQSSGDSGVNGTQVTNFSFTNGTINNAGNAGHESAIAFNSSPTTANNIAGTLTMTGNSITNAFYAGLDIESSDGTVSNATITGNTITNPGFSGVNIVGTGTATTVFNINNATIANNSITSSAGNGIQVNVGNSSTSGPGAHAGFVTIDGLGRPTSDASHIISITGNTITLDSTNGATQVIAVSNTGANSGSRTQTNFEIKNNGTVATPLSGSLIGSDILIGNNGYSDMAGVVDNNVIDANHTAGTAGGGGNGIAGGNGVAGAGNAFTPRLELAVTNNTITDTNGSGILLVSRGATGTAFFKIASNNVAAPNDTGGFATNGIEVDAGNNPSADDAVFLNIFGNTSAGTNGALGIGLYKQGNVATTNDFGIFDAPGGPTLASSPTNAQVEAFLASLNSSTVEIFNGSNFIRDTTLAPALIAAAGGVQASSPTPGETHLTQAQLDSVVAAAIGQWAAAGATAAQLAALHATTFSVSNLSDNVVGEQTPGHITIDADAAGHGWFVDPTPNDNSEFTHAQNAAGTDLLTDPSTDAAGHLDLLTTVTHELGHVLGLDDVNSPTDDLMFIDLVDGERRLPDAADVVEARASGANQAEAALPVSAQAAANTPIVVGTSGNDTIDAGHGGNILFGGAGADNFVFGSSIQLNAPTPAQVTHVADYHAAEGDTFDFSAITSAFHNSSVSDTLVVRAVEDASGKFATLQVDHIDPMGLPSAPNWVNVAQLDGAHSGDTVNVLIDNNHSVHLAQIHVDLLV